MLGFTWIAVQDNAGIFAFSMTYGLLAGAALCSSLDVSGVGIGMLLLPWALGLFVGELVGGATCHPVAAVGRRF